MMIIVYLFTCVVLHMQYVILPIKVSLYGMVLCKCYKLVATLLMKQACDNLFTTLFPAVNSFNYKDVSTLLLPCKTWLLLPGKQVVTTREHVIVTTL